MMIKKKQKKQNQPTKSQAKVAQHQTFAAHLLELRQRLFYSVASVLFFSMIAYFVQQQLVRFLLRPAHNQHFIYTSPGGGIAFLFQICTYVGITASIPVVVYQILRFIEPVIGDKQRRYILKMGWYSAALAIAGGAFGYLVGLPAALHFLSHQFTTKQIAPLLTIQEYMSFVTVYLIGSALIFQLPLIILFINRIKPLKPQRLLRYERYVVAGSFIVSMIMVPTINVVDQLMLAGPIIVMYQLAILLVMVSNKRRARAEQRAELQEVVTEQYVTRQRQAAERLSGLISKVVLPQLLRSNQAPARAPVEALSSKKKVSAFDIIMQPTRWSVPPNRTLIDVQFK